MVLIGGGGLFVGFTGVEESLESFYNFGTIVVIFGPAIADAAGTGFSS